LIFGAKHAPTGEKFNEADHYSGFVCLRQRLWFEGPSG
jgi:hypothetical protein